MKKTVSLILVGLSVAFSSFAQTNKTPSFRIQTTYDTVGVEEQFEIKYTLENGKAMGQFENPRFQGFQVVAGPMTSQSMSIINGDMTQSVSYTYIVKPMDLGLHLVPAASIETDAGVLVCDELALVVVEKVERRRYNSPYDAFQNPFFNDPFFNQNYDPRQRMDEMMKDFNQMFKMEPPTFYYENAPGQNQSPTQKPKKEEKVYKI